MQEQEKDLFKGYEIKHWDYSPYLYKIFAIAAVFNIVGLLALAQTNVLTTRGCESPFVGRVCQVIDTLYVGSTFLGNDGEFVSKNYDKAVIEDADITYIDVSNQSPPLNYPEGYFALANPNDFVSPDNMSADFMTMPPSSSGISSIPGIPTNPTLFNDPGNLMNTPQVVPTPNNNAVTGKIPTSPFSMGDNVIGANPTLPNRTLPSRKFPYNPARNPIGNKAKSPNKLPKFSEDDLTAENKPKPEEKESEAKPSLDSAPVTDFRPNKKPLEDFADEILVKRADKNKPLDLSKAFLVQMTGELDKDGKLIAKKSGYTKSEGDQEMVDLAKSAIEAINNSGMFYYLKSQGVDKVDFTLVQDEKQMYAVITSSQKTEERARTLSSGFNGLLLIAKGLVKEAELKTLIESSKVEPNGKNFVLNFKIDKPIVQEMIKRKLQEAEAKKIEAEKNNQTTNTAQTSNGNQTTAK